MNRREFLAHLGAGTLAIIGVGGIVRMLSEYGSNSRQHRMSGYGSSPYGGGFRNR